jgi:hypothetical protein
VKPGATYPHGRSEFDKAHGASQYRPVATLTLLLDAPNPR